MAIASCQAPTMMKPEAIYEKDLIISEGGDKFAGFGVLPRKKAYSFKFEGDSVAKKVRISNCHRDPSLSKDLKKIVPYEFIPSQRAELNGDCVMTVTYLSAAGRHQFGAVTFVDDETLPAKLECNGSRRNTDGVSACQARAGTLQTIDFSVKVAGQTITPGCNQPQSDNNLDWNITASEGFCLYVFRTDDKDFHRLTTFGYNEIDE